MRAVPVLTGAQLSASNPMPYFSGVSGRLFGEILMKLASEIHGQARSASRVGPDLMAIAARHSVAKCPACRALRKK